jgi:WhiB family redox-sensing transcriptional regulator
VFGVENSSLLLRPPGWSQAAACDGMATGAADPWDSDSPLMPIGRRICSSCPVRHPCALEALEGAIPHGLWGGLDPTDRRRIARKHGYPQPNAAAHGTYSKYVTCTLDNGRSCADCREAKRRYMQERRAQELEQPRKPAGTPRKPPTPQSRVLRVVRRGGGQLTARAVYRATGVKVSRVRQIVAAAEASGSLPSGLLAA